MRNLKDRIKHYKEGLFWNYRSLAVPTATILLCVFWYFNEGGMEPIVGIIISIIVILTSIKQVEEVWHSKIESVHYKIHYRKFPEEQIDKINSFLINKFDFVIKWKTQHHDGEFKTLHVDGLGNLPLENLREEALKNGFKLYRIEKDGEQILET